MYGNHSDEDEQQTKNASDSGAGEQPESSPLKGYLPKLIKRSASIDTSPANTASSGGNCEASSSPPSDPWRFFSDIKVLIIDKTNYVDKQLLKKSRCISISIFTMYNFFYLDQSQIAHYTFIY